MKTLLIATATVMTLTGAAMADNAQYAAQHFAMSEDGGDGARTVRMLTSEAEIISSKNADLAAFAKMKLSNGPEDRR